MSELPSAKVSKGLVTADPAKALPVGSELHFQPTPIIGEVPKGAATLRNWEFFEGLLLQIALTDGEFMRVEGSGVMVAPGVALCATHVIEPHLERLMTGRAIGNCFGICANNLQIWNIRKVTSVPNTDITILSVELTSDLPPGNTFIQSVITTRTPAIGEPLTICGFRAGEPTFQRGKKVVEASGEMWVCKGSIIQAFPLGRDKGMIRWPALAVSVPSHGGMSGGPVFDSHGLLVGLLCSSIVFGDGEGISYVCLLWPALTARFEGTWPSGLYRDAQSLIEIDRHLCAIDRPEAITVDYEETGNTHSGYRVWQ
jgi:trypsin-like peptidase